VPALALIAQYGEKASPAAFVKLLQALVIAKIL